MKGLIKMVDSDDGVELGGREYQEDIVIKIQK